MKITINLIDDDYYAIYSGSDKDMDHISGDAIYSSSDDDDDGADGYHYNRDGSFDDNDKDDFFER